VIELPASIQNLKRIGSAYLEATNQLGRPPNNAGELTPHLKRYGDPATILRSPADGQDYVILRGVDVCAAQAQKGGLPVLAYEQKGDGQKRYVLLTRQVVHLTDEEFKQAPFPPGHKAPS